MTNEEITKEQKRISKELRELSEKLGNHGKARCEINKRYGKGWRENLEIKKTFGVNHYKMSYL